MTLFVVKAGYDLSYGTGCPTEIKDIIDNAVVLRMLLPADFKLRDGDETSWVMAGHLYRFIVDSSKLIGQEVWKYISIVERLTDPNTSIASIADKKPDGGTYNQLVNVAVGGSTLHIDAVKVVEDYCTDQLQKELDSGWRIVAVCVQPNQRRPDYILGKTNDN